MHIANKNNKTANSTSLVERIQQGDSQAEREMVDRYSKGLNAMLFSRCHDRALSEDVAQDTWILVIKKVRQQELHDSARLTGFVMQIAKNQLIMAMRNRTKRIFLSVDDAAEVSDTGPTPDQSVINRELGKAISSALNEMSKPRDRELIKRFYLVGDSKEQLCKEYNLTHAHFDAVLSRARKRFKKLWGKYEKTE